MNSWEELGDFVEKVAGKRPHTGDLLQEVLSGLPAVYAQLQAENKRLREAAQLAADDAKPVYTSSKNSVAVRKGFEVGGSVMHYEIPPRTIHKLKSALENNDER